MIQRLKKHSATILGATVLVAVLSAFFLAQLLPSSSEPTEPISVEEQTERDDLFDRWLDLTMQQSNLDSEIFELEKQQWSIQENWLRDMGLTLGDLQEPDNLKKYREYLEQNAEFRLLRDLIALKEQKSHELEATANETIRQWEEMIR